MGLAGHLALRANEDAPDVADDLGYAENKTLA